MCTLVLIMDLRKFCSRKRSASTTEGESSSEPTPKILASQTSDQESQAASAPQKKKSSKAEKKKEYKSHLSYRKEWERAYPWVYCTNSDKGMFCRICQRYGHPPLKTKGGWTVRGICDWNHATELLKLHDSAKWHKDAAIAARMAEQSASSGSVLDLCVAASTKQIEEERKRNRSVLLKLLRLIYFLAKNRIPHMTTFEGLVKLQ